MIDYYSARAREYDRVYEKPERQSELDKIKSWIGERFHQQEVLDLACGTGYWSQYLARNAKSLTGADLSLEVLEIASARDYPVHTEFIQSNLFSTPFLPGSFDSVFAGFIISHIERQQLPDFADTLIRLVRPGGRIVLVDNLYVERSSTPISRQDERGNTFQLRTLSSGETHEVLKNFPTISEIQKLFDGRVGWMRWSWMEYYFLVEVGKGR